MRLKKYIKYLFNLFGYKLLKIENNQNKLFFEYLNKSSIFEYEENKFFEIRPELEVNDIEIIKYIFKNKLTMVSPNRLTDTLLAAKHVSKNNIPGAFVECGTWRGGNAIAAGLIFQKYGIKKDIYLFDTFLGMTKPKENIDETMYLNKTSTEVFNESQIGEYNSWCYASLEEVKSNFTNAGLNIENIKFIKGDVEKTLDVLSNLPKNISVLRLDTDWYDSTKKELESLYNRLSINGVLIVDDYGYWNGAKKAFDEFFQQNNISQPFMISSDFTGRVGVKTS